MSIHVISDDGTLHWTCLGLGEKCQNPITIHITHEGVRWHPTDDGFVVMPPCPKCGAQMMVKVFFDEEDLHRPNAMEYGMIPQQMTVPHAITGELIPVMIPTLMAVGANPAIARHRRLATLMDMYDKKRPTAPSLPRELDEHDTTTGK